MIKIGEIAEKLVSTFKTSEVKGENYEKLTQGLAGDNSMGNEGIEVQYSSASKEASETADSKNKGKTEYKYDENGNMASSETKNDNGQVTKRVSYIDGKARMEEFEYDDKGNISKQKTTERDGATKENEYKYDKNGRVSRETITNSKGANEVVTYKYDAQGRITGKTEKGVDSDGKVIDKSDTYVYDKNGRLKEITDKDGNKKVYNYNNAGDVTTVTALDKDGNIVEENKISNEEEQMCTDPMLETSTTL